MVDLALLPPPPPPPPDPTVNEAVSWGSPSSGSSLSFGPTGSSTKTVMSNDPEAGETMPKVKSPSPGRALASPAASPPMAPSEPPPRSPVVGSIRTGLTPVVGRQNSTDVGDHGANHRRDAHRSHVRCVSHRRQDEHAHGNRHHRRDGASSCVTCIRDRHDASSRIRCLW